MLPACQPANLCSIDALSRDIYFTSLFPRLSDKERVCLAATCRLQLSLFHKFSLDFIKVIGNKDLKDLQEALSKNSLENQTRVAQILRTSGFSWNRAVSFESNVYDNFPQYRKASSLYLSASGRAYLISLGIGYSMIVKMSRSELTLDSALDSVAIAKEKIASVCQGGKAALLEIIKSHPHFNTLWIRDTAFENATRQIQKNKGLQKYVICGEIDLFTAVARYKTGDLFEQLENPALQHALDTGKITVHFFLELHFCQALVLRLCQNKKWDLLSELIQVHYVGQFYLNSGGSIPKALNDEWVMDAILSRKIKLQGIEAFCGRVVYLNPAGERIALQSDIEQFSPEELVLLDREQYSILNFKPIQQAIDQGDLSLQEAKTMTLDELNKKVPDFYKETFFDRANYVSSKMKKRIQSGITDAIIESHNACLLQ